MLATDQILQGRYRIIRKLGAGGMGAVYEAIDERFGEPIALKEIIIESDDEKQKESVSRAFEREAKALAKAKHEAVPFVRDYFFELDRQFLVMELVEGEDLGGMLKKRGTPFSTEDAVNWMDQLLDALDYLHNLKPPIIHRDIKPQNLKLNFRRRIKLLDFGIARSGDKSATITNQTFVGATLNYSPIEQILRVIDSTFREFIILKHKEKAERVLSQDTDGRCDIYSLGGTFYHLLTNRVPVESTKRTLDIWEGKPDPLINPTELNLNIPPEISACLMKALAIECDQRFSSAIEMQFALKTAIHQSKTENSAEFNKNISSQLETLPLITKEDLRVETPTEPNLSYPSVPNQPIDLPVGNTNLPTKDSGFGQPAKTMPSGNFVNSDLTSASYLEGILPEEKKTSPDIVPFIEKPVQQESNKPSKLLWAIPIVVVGFMALAGIGGLFWISMSLGESASNKTASNIAVLTPTPTVTPSTVTPTPSPIVSPSATPSIAPTPEPTVAPTQPKSTPQNPKVVLTPNKTPVPVRTPKATPKPKQDPNCVFTNSCQ
jgi:serine/threonine protein kinase